MLIYFFNHKRSRQSIDNLSTGDVDDDIAFCETTFRQLEEKNLVDLFLGFNAVQRHHHNINRDNFFGSYLVFKWHPKLILFPRRCHLVQSTPPCDATDQFFHLLYCSSNIKNIDSIKCIVNTNQT